MKDKLTKEGFGRFTELKEWGRGVDMELFSPERRSTGNEYYSIYGIVS